MNSKVLFSVLIGFLMITSVIGIVLVNFDTSGRGSLRYKGYVFERQQDGSLVSMINGKAVSFTLFPAEVENIPLDISAVSMVKGTRMVYVTSDFDSNFSGVIAAVQLDLGKALREHYGIFVVQGFTQNVSNLPVVSCANATSFVPVVSFEEGNVTGIFESGGCIIVNADSYDGFVKARDRFLYGVLGVIDGNRGG